MSIEHTAKLNNNDSFQPIKHRATPWRNTFSFFSRLSPTLTSRVAAQLFTLPQRHQLTEQGAQLLAEGTPLSVHIGAKRLAGWRWGVGPSLLLVHGWSGAAVQFAPLIRSLVASNYSVLAFDLPAHGQSGGKQTNLFESSNSIRSIASTYGPFHGVVGHSFGGLAAALAADAQALAKQLVLVSPLTGANYALRTFGSMIGVTEAVQNRMREYFERTIGISFADFDFSVLAARLDLPTLVIHDRSDRIIDWDNTENWVDACDAAQLMTTEGLGHQRILADARVAERIKTFLGSSRIDIRQTLLAEYAL